MPCGGPKKSHRTSSIVQIILFLSVLEVSKTIQNIKNKNMQNIRKQMTVRLEQSSRQCFNYLTPFTHMSLIEASLV